METERGFSLVEVLMVLVIIGILTAVIMPRVQDARKSAQYTKAIAEFKSIETALGLYFDDNASLPADVARGVSPGLGAYLGGSSEWPVGPWDGSMYDWDNWVDPDDSSQRIRQISIRFCPEGGILADCTFPDEPWAAGFDVDSALYYCIEGACRSEVSQPVNYPGYCVNC